MNIKTLLILLLLSLVSFSSTSQITSTDLTNTSQVISEQNSGQDQISYSDSAHGYSVIIPKWWTIKDTPNTNFFLEVRLMK